MRVELHYLTMVLEQCVLLNFRIVINDVDILLIAAIVFGSETPNVRF